MATGDELVVTVNRKQYKLTKDELAKASQAAAKGWLRTAKNYHAQMQSVHSIWKTHYEMREEYFLTSRVIQAATSAYFPTQADLNRADTAVDNLKSQAGAAKLTGIESANHEAYRAVKLVTQAMDNYTKVMCGSATNLVAGTEFIMEASKDAVELLAQLALAKAPGGAALAAGASGGYNELLDQIVKAQGPDAPGGVAATALVINAGLRDGLIKHFMGDGKFGGKIVEKLGKEAAKIIGKHIAEKEAAEIVEAMFKKELEEFISSSLKELLKAYTPGQKITFEQAAQTVFTDVAKKMALPKVLGKIPAQIAKVEETIVDKIKKGAIKGVKLEGKDLEAEVKKTVEAAVEKVLEKAIKNRGADMDKLHEEMAAELLKDSAFKASVTKIAARKK